MRRYWMCLSAILFVMVSFCPYRALAEAPDQNNAADSWNSKCRSLLRRVAEVASEERTNIWSEGLRELSGGTALISNKTLADIHRTIVTIDDDTTFSPAQVLIDLLKLNLDPVSNRRLQSRLGAYKLRKAFASHRPSGRRLAPISADGRRMMLLADAMRLKGEHARAISLYTNVIKEQAENQRIALFVRRKVLPLLLGQEQIDVDIIQEHLDAFTGTGEGVSDQIGNFALQLLFLRVSAASREEHKDVWTKGVRTLRCDDIVLAEQTLRHVDKLIDTLDANGSLSPEDVLADLLILLPDVSSMQKLQRRRVAAFVRLKDWPRALQAARFDIMLAAATAKGPFASIRQYIQIMQKAGLSAVELENTEEALRWGTSANPGTRDNKSDSQPPTRQIASLVDPLLKGAAERVLNDRGEGISPRRRAFLNLFIGNVDDATRDIRSVLIRSAGNKKQLARALDDSEAVIAIAERSFHSSSRLDSWLAAGGGKDRQSVSFDEDARAKLRRAWLKERKRRLIEWGADALRAGDIAWAEAFWVLAIDVKEQAEETMGPLNAICENIEQADRAGQQETIKILREMIGHVNTPAIRRQLLLKIAALLHEEGEFAECLDVLDRADELASGLDDKQLMRIGFIRVLGLIRLGNFDDAVGVLKRMESWSASAEEHARALFLIGWVRLQQNEKSEATDSFRKIIDRHPKTSFAGKVRQLIERLEGI